MISITSPAVELSYVREGGRSGKERGIVALEGVETGQIITTSGMREEQSKSKNIEISFSSFFTETGTIVTMTSLAIALLFASLLCAMRFNNSHS